MFELSLLTEMAEQPQEEAEAGLECAVCLQTSIYPVQLPCSHVFCFLCVKGFSAQSKRCAMCRREIPEDFIQNPDLLPKVNLQAVTERAFEAGTFPIFTILQLCKSQHNQSFQAGRSKDIPTVKAMF